MKRILIMVMLVGMAMVSCKKRHCYSCNVTVREYDSTSISNDIECGMTKDEAAGYEQSGTLVYGRGTNSEVTHEKVTRCKIQD